jgi:hypothetical protein
MHRCEVYYSDWVMLCNGSRSSEGVAQSDVSTCLAFTHLMGAVVHRVLTTARPLFTAT